MKSILLKIKNNPLYINASIVSIITIITGILNFVFNIIVGTILGKEQYGIIYPLISLFLIFSIPETAIRYVVTKDISFFIHEQKFDYLKFYLNKILKFISYIILIFISILLILTPFFENYYHIKDKISFIIIYILIFINIIIIPFNCIVQSRERFNVYIIGSLFSTLIKFIMGISLVYITLNYRSVLIGILLSQVVILLFYLIDFINFNEIKIKGYISNNNIFNWRLFSKLLLNSLLSVGAFQLFTYIDTVLVRHYLPNESGLYSMVNLIGKSSFYFSLSVSYVILPIMSKNRKSITNSNKEGLLFLTILLVLFSIFLYIFSPFISKFLFKNKYLGLENYLPIYSFMFIPYPLINYMINYYIVSEKSFYYIIILFGVLLQFIGIILFHTSLFKVIITIGVVGYFVFTILLINSTIRLKEKFGKFL